MRSDWYGTGVSQFDSVLSFWLRERKLGALIQQSRLTSGFCSPVQGSLVYAGSLSHQLSQPVEGAGFFVADLLGRSSPDLSSAMVFYMARSEYHYVHAPEDLTIVDCYEIESSLSITKAVTEKSPGIYAGKKRCVLVGVNADGVKVVLVLIGTRTFGDIVCPVKEGFDPDHPVSFKKGDILGYFVRGSTVVMMMGKPLAYNIKDLGKSVDALSSMGAWYEE
ncbi:phosphatidylserine decarboxylase [Candidatus Comchoanobacter bicostacola]|uniref:Phosphatidylserine decarboxylase n=1 Tax=Candidatus Comchoanobacter bicostacola TaxID=2919598 RepID=A0ABY5DJ26_9GAMM|nr:phosphatidylserine decarboxylase [Candidatus Comchoanobacter bicostacola]UTC24570.1 phosphatidylserine decarboxylase [Candidatus Comchoanobacter bicostacola]